MEKSLRFLIIDGYPKKNRQEFKLAGMSLACDLYAKMLLKYLPEARYDVLFPSDEGVVMPGTGELEAYAGYSLDGVRLMCS